MIKLYLQLIWRICKLQAGPEDVPHSNILLIGIVILSVLLGWLPMLLQKGLAAGLMTVVATLTVMVLFVYAVLQIRGLARRFVQTLTAIVSVDILIKLVALPFLILMAWMIAVKPEDSVLNTVSFLYLIVILVVNVWGIIVTAHIFRRALNTRFIVGLLITFAMIGLEMIVFKQLV